MGTDKRARQKANRAMKNEQMAKQAKKDQMKRRGVRWGVAAVAGVAVVLLLAWVFGAFDGDDDGDVATIDPLATVATTAASVPGSSAPTSAPTTAAAIEPVCPEEDGSSPKAQAFTAAPPMCIDETATYDAVVTTNEGAFTIRLDASKAPQAVNNFVFLARYHYFDDTPCHRIIPGFVVQCGDPTGSGSGGPGYSIPDELPAAGEYEIGSVAMANSGPDTSGSQFFVITGDQGAALDPNYTLFGAVTDGLDSTLPALDALGNPDPSANGVPPLQPVTIESVTITQG